jgi:hypothetical protein
LIEQFKNSKLNETLWYGVVEEIDELNYNVTDFLIPPQIQTGVHCETDDIEWPKWSYENILKPRKTIRLQGHTHPVFVPLPSSGDKEYLGERIKNMRLEINEYMFEWILSYKNIYYCKKHTIIDNEFNTKSELVTINILK